MNVQENWEGPKLNGPYEGGTVPKHPHNHSGCPMLDTRVSVMLGYGASSLLDRFLTFQDSVISSSGVKNSMKIGYFYYKDVSKCR
jgi:hypothetical protein